MIPPQREKKNKSIRFRRPEFQEKLARARGFQRRTEPIPENSLAGAFYRAGWRSTFSQWLSVLILAAVVYFLTISHLFLVETAAVQSGNLSAAVVSSALKAMESSRIYLVPSNNILLLTQARLLQYLQKSNPEIRKVIYFRRTFPNKLAVGLEERQPLYIWRTGQNYFFIDQDGVAYQKLGSYDPVADLQAVITDRTAQDIATGTNLGIARLLIFLESLRQQWPGIITETSAFSFAVPGNASPDAYVRTGIGFYVYFDLGRGVTGQLKNLALLLNGPIKPETYGGLSYIDLRLPTVGYYCYRDAPCAAASATSTIPLP